MGNAIDKFFLLMWKNLLLLYRNLSASVTEVISPIFISVMLLMICSFAQYKKIDAAIYKPFENKFPVNQASMSAIVWSPKNPQIEKIIDSFIENVNTKYNVKMNAIAFDDAKSMENYLIKATNETLAGIQFDAYLKGDVELGENINVRLRFPSELRIEKDMDWKTNKIFPVLLVAGPRYWKQNEGASPSYHDEGFLALQQELSLAIINYFKLARNQPAVDESFKILMQRFPHPKWVFDTIIVQLKITCGLLMVLGLSTSYSNIVQVLAVEKERKIKEYMKIMGLSNWLNWTAWFVKSFLIMLVIVIIMVCLLKFQWFPRSYRTIFPHSSLLLIVLFFIPFIISTITFAFATSVFFSKASKAVVFSELIYLLTILPFAVVQHSNSSSSFSAKLVTSIFGNSAIIYGFQIIMVLESFEEGLQWANIWRPVAADDNFTVGHVIVMLLVDAVIYLLIALYVEAVFPGEYGVPLVWYFPCSTSYWRGDRRESLDIEEYPIENEFYEDEPSNLEAGVQVYHLTKEFSHKLAVKDVTMNIFKNQITVLLGHNGAGKTTTMSMITGMFPPTRGTAVVNGCDIRNNIGGARQSLGFCPQYNILYDELTVRDHLYFYCCLKGLKKHKINAEIHKYLDAFQLISKKDTCSKQLSGGMQRKLSTAIAFCANSSVVIIDEPSTGMDPSARRGLWDLLQSQRKGRTIFLTTHNMEEADVLGDRIAIMAGGELKCCGTSFFLKQKYGAGYHLVIDKSPECSVPKITSLLKTYIPDIEVENEIGPELTYVLNKRYVSSFHNILRELENNSTSYGILSLGISLTTLEEVFMKVGAEHDSNQENDSHGGNSTLTNNITRKNFKGDPEIGESNNATLQESHLPQVLFGAIRKPLKTGCSLFCNQFYAMLFKHGVYHLRSWWEIIIQICIAIVAPTMGIIMARYTSAATSLPDLKIHLDSYNNPTTVLTRTTTKYSEEYIEALQKHRNKLINWENANMNQKLLEASENNLRTVRERYIIGASFQENAVTAWFNNDPCHSPSLALQMIMNAILHKEVSVNHNIQIYNYPLPYTLQSKITHLSSASNIVSILSFIIAMIMVLVTAFYIMFYIRERRSGAKHLQLASGTSIISFWGASLLCDLLCYIFICGVLMITIIAFQEDGFKTSAELGRTFLIFLYFWCATFPMMYLASFIFDLPSTGYSTIVTIGYFSALISTTVLRVIPPDLRHITVILHYIFLIFPPYSVLSGIRDVCGISSKGKFCKSHIGKYCPMTRETCELACMTEPECCNISENYYSMAAPGIGKNIIFSCCTGILFVGILLAIEFRVIQKYFNNFGSDRTHLPRHANPQIDNDVALEKEKIKSATMKEIKDINLVVRGVSKYYKDFLAVNDLCLGVKKFECFGLLGVNGAGKTTTFKIMTGEIRLTYGDVWVNGMNIKTKMRKISQLLGYCPQFDALFDNFTSRETLIIYGLIRGLSMTDCKVEAKQLAVQLGFYKHFNKQVKQLSGGNKRKLSTAVALIGDPLIVFLDEPTAGMDPANRRLIWNAICQIRSNGKCIVLTSHSMDECEALCTRLAIMVNGEFMCLGSTQHLKSKFSKGYTLTIKLNKPTKLTDMDSQFQQVDTFVRANFDGVSVSEKFENLITYYIDDIHLTWSKIFRIMEHGRTSLNIEDYSLSQCSLEQVFLTFAKQQHR